MRTRTVALFATLMRMAFGATRPVEWRSSTRTKAAPAAAPHTAADSSAWHPKWAWVRSGSCSCSLVVIPRVTERQCVVPVQISHEEVLRHLAVGLRIEAGAGQRFQVGDAQWVRELDALIGLQEIHRKRVDPTGGDGAYAFRVQRRESVDEGRGR